MTNKPFLLPDPFIFPAYPPDLPRLDADDTEGSEYITRASLEIEHACGVSLSCMTNAGSTVSVQINLVSPGIVRVLLEGESLDQKHLTLAKNQSDQDVDIWIETTEKKITIKSDEITSHIDLDPFHLHFSGYDGRSLLEQNYTHRDATGRMTMLPFGFTNVDGKFAAFHDTFTAEPDEHFYGFGEKFTDFDKRGQRLEMWLHNTYGVHSEMAYKNVPFFISTRGYGIFVDSLYCTRFDMAFSNHATYSFITPDSALDYYVITGTDLKTIISRYSSLTSFPILPPKWAFGLWMSSGFQHDTSEDVLDRARQLRKQEIPCDVLHLDCYWQRHGAWSDMKWDREAFPDPEAMIVQIRDMGFRVCLWKNPYLGIESELFPKAVENGYLLKTAEGEPYILDLWDGYHPPVGIVDFTNPEAELWYRTLLRPLLRMGVDVFKTDFGESIPHDAVAHNGMTGETLHNLYPLLYNDLVSAITAEESDHTGLVWARSSYAGGQRHAIQWGADCDCSYQGLASTLRGGLSIGMCGHAFWSHDIGGFYIQPTPELYIRWAQFGLLSPFSRAHGVTTRLPWDYGDEALRIFRDYVHLRYKLLPYIFTYAMIAAETSIPILRPMVLEFPDDPSTYNLDLQYMLGEELLVAPIYNSAGHRPVYIPEGKWVDYWTHEIIEGPKTIWVKVPLEVIPLYVRGNALIPTMKPTNHLSEEPFDSILFECYLLENGSFKLRDTDGNTHIKAAIQSTQLDLKVDGVKNRLGLKLLPLTTMTKLDSIILNGKPLVKKEQLNFERGMESAWMRNGEGSIHILMLKSEDEAHD